MQARYVALRIIRCLLSLDMLLHPRNQYASRSAFSFIELVGVVAFCCVIIALGLPSFMHRAERQLAAEAVNYLEHIKQLQQQHFAEHGYYAPDPMTLDLALVVPAAFSIEATKQGHDIEFPETWSMTLTRQGSAYFCDKYSVTYNESGLVPDAELLAADLVPRLRSVKTSQAAH